MVRGARRERTVSTSWVCCQGWVGGGEGDGGDGVMRVVITAARTAELRGAEIHWS